MSVRTPPNRKYEADILRLRHGVRTPGNDANVRNPNEADHRNGNYWLCYRCSKPHSFRRGMCIKCLIETHPFKGVEKVKVKATGKVGTVLYLYYNGYTLVKFPRKPIRGGAFNNDSTFRNDELEAA